MADIDKIEPEIEVTFGSTGVESLQPVRTQIGRLDAAAKAFFKSRRDGQAGVAFTQKFYPILYGKSPECPAGEHRITDPRSVFL